jgi:DNA-binding protein
MFQLHDKGQVEIEATGSAIEKLVRTVAKLREMLNDINVSEVEFREVDYNGKKKAKLKVKVIVLQ